MKPNIGAGHRLEKALEATIRRVTETRRTMALSVRLTEGERERLEIAAKKRGIPTATFAKSIILTTLDTLERDGE
ncbi:MAG: hypothetical protein HYX75_13005 [Acidobacteria bacterium]|nr:hypothetical protein [Acidobacteriota bacterium]